MMSNINIKIFEDISCHFELETNFANLNLGLKYKNGNKRDNAHDQTYLKRQKKCSTCKALKARRMRPI